MNYKIINFRKAVYIFGELFNKLTFFVIKYFQFKKDSAMLIFVTVYICAHNNCMIDTQYLHTCLFFKQIITAYKRWISFNFVSLFNVNLLKNVS